jgi:hypothetical protein
MIGFFVGLLYEHETFLEGFGRKRLKLKEKIHRAKVE